MLRLTGQADDDENQFIIVPVCHRATKSINIIFHSMIGHNAAYGNTMHRYGVPIQVDMVWYSKEVDQLQQQHHHNLLSIKTINNQYRHYS